MRLLCATIACALLSFGCTPDFAKQSEADVILRIDKIVTLAGESEDEGDFLLSDVTPVFNDNARITFSALPVNPILSTDQLGRFNDVMLERYEVRFFRTDGRNQEGVDVPFRFTGPMATVVVVGAPTDAAVILVRHTAKLEPPLKNMAFVPGTVSGGGHNILHAIAEMTFHGRTTSGKAVTATGRVSISFADFADDEPAPSPSPTSAFAFGVGEN